MGLGGEKAPVVLRMKTRIAAVALAAEETIMVLLLRFCRGIPYQPSSNFRRATRGAANLWH